MGSNAEFLVRAHENPSLAGNLYFSKTQWTQLRNNGKMRTFGMLRDGQIVEYTELVTIEQIAMGDVMPLETDAQFIGQGVFHHHGIIGDTKL